ncbi:MAG: ribonuclease H-like domain-containing protein, partial [Dehalococcoidia bacterium]
GLSTDLATAGALVSYNGKSFDVPLLESRYILSRLPADLRSRPHLDLLHPNRRLFRGVLASHRLTEIEVHLLGFRRESDCPSWEVPERYFRFQRDGDPTWIRPVLRHNAWDILSLVALAAHLAEVCDGEGHPLQAARAAEYTRDFASAAGHYGRAAAGGSQAERLEAIEHAALCARRAGQHDQAAHWWHTLLAEPRSRRLLPYVELAKHYEHHARDLGAALGLAEKALALARTGIVHPGPPGSPTSVEALDHRASRLRRKLLTSGG